MNEQSENFEALLKLLALKRYEQPPPGYFNTLPGRIIHRIETEKEPSFLEKFSRAFVLRPVVSFALGLTFCGTFVSGLLYSMQSGAIQCAAAATSDDHWASANNGAVFDGSGEPITLHVPGFNANNQYVNYIATNGDPLPKASLFEDFRVQPVHFSPVH